MKTITRQLENISDGVKDSAFFYLDDENVPHIFGILRGSLYSDKPLAVIREYSCNGQDAHVEAGCPEKPIQVKMPNHFDPILVIRDFGPGMSHEDVMKVYNSYGKSTKRGTNEQIGMLGIGSKSAFCYGESFSITSFFNGTMRLYEAYIDESERGIVALIGDEPTTEPNGIKISVKVKTSDIIRFEDTAKKFFKTFEPKPEILGNQRVADFINGISDEVLLKGKDWKIMSTKTLGYGYSDSKIYVRMGNIVYPFDLSHLDSFAADEKWVRPMGYSELHINVGIGDVKFSANRENLDYNDKTIAFVKQRVREIYAELRIQVEKDISIAPNLWTARKLLKLRKDSIGHIDWKPCYKGVVLESFHVPDDAIKALGITIYKQNYRGHFKDGYAVESYSDPIVYLFKTEEVKESQWSAKAKYHISTLAIAKGEKYVLKGTTAQIKKVLDHKEFIGANFVDLSTIILPKRKSTSQANLRKNRNLGKVSLFKWSGGTAFPYSDNWEPTEVKKSDNIVYAEIEKFVPIYTCGSTKLNWIKDATQNYKSLTGNTLEVYGVRKGSDIPKNWVSLKSFIETNSAMFFKEAPIVKAINFQLAQSEMPTFLKGLSKMLDCCGEGKLKELVELHENYSKGGFEADDRLRRVREFARLVNLNTPSAVSFNTLIKEVEDKYKFLPLFDDKSYYYNKDGRRCVENYKAEFKALVELVESGKL